MTRGTAKILKAQLELATRDHTAAVGDVFQSPQFLVMELAVPGGKHILQRKAIPMLLEDVHCSRRGRPCIVMGCHGWIPTAGEQTAVEKSIKVSTGLNPKVNLVSADKLMMEIPSCTRMFDREAASVP
ncbi:unnamed protein product [Durusdinium trenchii]|uniref:Uncharacterized protein n=1 Tax=Durusdinium trenchii TaxID=1381693 RepID=A0ABP0M6G7_9DINO